MPSPQPVRFDRVARWASIARELPWHTPWHITHARVQSFRADPRQGWFIGGTVSAFECCLGRQCSSEHGGRTAVILPDGSALTWKQLRAQAETAAAELRASGAQPGRPARIASDCPQDALFDLLGCAAIGAIAVLGSPHHEAPPTPAVCSPCEGEGIVSAESPLFVLFGGEREEGSVYETGGFLVRSLAAARESEAPEAHLHREDLLSASGLAAGVYGPLAAGKTISVQSGTRAACLQAGCGQALSGEDVFRPSGPGEGRSLQSSDEGAGLLVSAP